MLEPENDLIELVRHKDLCTKSRIDLDRISTGLLRSNCLSDKETELLYKVQANFNKLQGFENTIDRYLRKFLN